MDKNLNFTNPIISIIIPCYNEEISLQNFFQEITQVMQKSFNELAQFFQNSHKRPFYELIFINDGSKDSTQKILESFIQNHKDPNFLIHTHSFSRNFGKEAAILAGFHKANGEGIILIDADLQHPPYLIPEMITIWLNSNREIKNIYARRKDRSGEQKIRAFCSELFYKATNIISDVKIEPGVSDFRLIDKEALHAIIQMKEYHRFSKNMFAWIGFKRQCIEYDYIPHAKNSSSWSFFGLFKYAIEGIISFSTMPLRIAFVLGLCMSIFSLLYGIYMLTFTLLFGNPVKGYASLFVLISFIGGIQLLVLGIIGEYIARIYEQIKQRPNYIIEKSNSSNHNKHI